MAKKRKPLQDWLIYIVVRGVVCVLQALPVRWALAFGDLLGIVAYRTVKRYRQVADENLKFAYPHLNDQHRDQLVRGCFQHYALLVIEIILLPRKFHVGNWRKYATMIHGDRTLSELLSDRPVLIVTAHFGNWELAGYAMGLFGFQTYAIARVLDNPHIERFFKKFRQATGQTIIAKKDDFDRLGRVLTEGGKVATLGDQDAGPKGVFINFMNRPASAHKAVALMAMEFQARMIVIGIPRVRREADRFHYQIICEDVIDPRDYEQSRDPVREMTQRYHDALARVIHRYPEQYFWLHRRWKTAPAVRRKKATV